MQTQKHCWKKNGNPEIGLKSTFGKGVKDNLPNKEEPQTKRKSNILTRQGAPFWISTLFSKGFPKGHLTSVWRFSGFDNFKHVSLFS